MPENTIRIGAIIDASGIPGGVQTILDALAEMRTQAAVTGAQSKQAMQQYQQAMKDAASEDAKSSAVKMGVAMRINFETVDLQA